MDVQTVESYKYLGGYLNNKLDWTCNATPLLGLFWAQQNTKMADLVGQFCFKRMVAKLLSLLDNI